MKIRSSKRTELPETFTHKGEPFTRQQWVDGLIGITLFHEDTAHKLYEIFHECGSTEIEEDSLDEYFSDIPFWWYVWQGREDFIQWSDLYCGNTREEAIEILEIENDMDRIIMYDDGTILGFEQ